MPIQSTLVGNYPKVTEEGSDHLSRTIDRWQKKLVNDEELEQELQKVIRRVIREQEEAGLTLVTDGQIRWEDLPHPFSRSVTGVRRGALRRFFDTNTYYRRLEPQNGVVWKESWVAQQFQFASKQTQRPVKVTLPGPLTLVDSTELPKGKNRETVLALYTDCLKKEVQALADAGVREIQLEEPTLQPKEPLLEAGLAAINKIFDGIRARRWLALYFFDLSPILEKLAKLNLEVLSLDLVAGPKLINKLNPFKGKELALGLVDARNTKLESVQQLRGLIQRAAKVISKEKLWVSSNCGLEFLPHESAKKKLALLQEAANSI